ncbi:MAG: fumarylacetoacetate hydrolase family protein [Candidatus Rariloculaceae bacterium]
MSYLNQPVTPAVKIAGRQEKFAVRRVYCVGWNYEEHIREMGQEPEREPPVFFMKPPDALVPNGGLIPYPTATQNLHYEVELVVAIGRSAKDIATSAAQEIIYGYAVGLDMTRRDLQAHAKKNGQPWALAKGFDHSAPISAIHPACDIGHPSSGSIWLEVNGKRRQDGDLSTMIWSVPEIIQHLSGYFELFPGDLIFTGTPAGVSAVVQGDQLRGGIEMIDTLEITLG